MSPHLKKSINQAYLENGVEADEHIVKIQMTVTKKEQNTEKPNRKQNE